MSSDVLRASSVRLNAAAFWMRGRFLCGSASLRSPRIWFNVGRRISTGSLSVTTRGISLLVFFFFFFFFLALRRSTALQRQAERISRQILQGNFLDRPYRWTKEKKLRVLGILNSVRSLTQRAVVFLCSCGFFSSSSVFEGGTYLRTTWKLSRLCCSSPFFGARSGSRRFRIQSSTSVSYCAFFFPNSRPQ